MDGAVTDLLKRVIETQHGGVGTFVQSVRVHKAGAKSDWDGIVHVFDLKGHPKSKRAYAWTSPVKGSAKPRYFAVLHEAPKVTSPVEAVKAAAAAIQRWS
jgi:hypothetical protein